MRKRIKLKDPDKLIWAYRNLYAVEKLEGFYKSKLDAMTYVDGIPTVSVSYASETNSFCPLCVANSAGINVNGKLFDICTPSTSYFPCPWIEFEGATCIVYFYDTKYLNDRLTRLARWRERLKATIQECWEDV